MAIDLRPLAIGKSVAERFWLIVCGLWPMAAKGGIDAEKGTAIEIAPTTKARRGRVE
jgi:hypothetical protein